MGAAIIAASRALFAQKKTDVPGQQLRVAPPPAGSVSGMQLAGWLAGVQYRVTVGSGLSITKEAGNVITISAAAPPTPPAATKVLWGVKATSTDFAKWTVVAPAGYINIVAVFRNGIRQLLTDDYTIDTITPTTINVNPVYGLWDDGANVQFDLTT
jgi:hypothetical protein